MGRRGAVRARLRCATCRRVVLGAGLAGLLLASVPLPRSAGSGVAVASADAVPPARHLTAVPGGIRIVRAGYQLVVDPRTAVVQVASPAGILYSSWPLVGIVDRDALPPGAVRQVTAHGDVVTAEVVAGGATLSRAVLTPGEQWFTISLEVLPGDTRSPTTEIFSDGHRGIDLGTLGEGFSPDPAQQAHGRTHLPTVDTAVRTPFSPAPFDVQMHSAAGWLGMGLVQLPDATSFGLGPEGALELDGAPAPSARTPLRLPDVVVTMAVDPLVGLRTYHDALVAAGTAPATPPRGPAWWHDPIVDTWGEQVAERRARQSAGFTAAWVRSFVGDVKRRYGLDHFTLVIDSMWQAAVGEPAPDPVRFGGYAGMRRLVDDLHAQGLHVLLWWPMWARDIAHVPPRRADLARGGAAHLVDPTATGFDGAMAATVSRLLGSGSGGLDADGLKLDWAYDLPATFAHPSQGTGARALHAYLAAIHSSAHALRPGALVEASAVAPQFQDVADSVRLYDAWHESDWLARAEIVAATDPGELVDGDGWQTDPRDALQHAVASAVYGVPALYFDGRWADGSGVAARLATEIGQVLALASLKGDGLAVGGPEGWTWTGTATAAWTLDHERDALVWREDGCGGSGVLVATAAGEVVLPLRVSGRVVVTAAGRPIPAAGTHPRLRVAASTVYHVVATC